MSSADYPAQRKLKQAAARKPRPVVQVAGCEEGSDQVQAAALYNMGHQELREIGGPSRKCSTNQTRSP